MKSAFLLLFLVVNTALFAQGPAFDKNCYFPQIGVKGEIDEVWADSSESMGGAPLLNIGPTPGKLGDRIITTFHSDNLTILHSASGFLLSNPPRDSLGFKVFSSNYRHFAKPFRQQGIVDLLAMSSRPRIYWADDQGLFDSNNYTLLLPPNPRKLSLIEASDPYLADFNGDSVCDILMVIIFVDSTDEASYRALEVFYGGDKLYKPGDTAIASEVFNLPLGESFPCYFKQGDIRGVGRDDLFRVDADGNWFYYRNEPPFSLKGLASSVRFDTLLSTRQNWQFGYSAIYPDWAFVRALPREPDDRSVDLIVSARLVEEGVYKNSLRVFRGGKDFGTARLLFDSTVPLIHYPAYYDTRFRNVAFGGRLGNAGNMRGDNTPMLYVDGGDGSTTFRFVYSFGEGFNDLADASYYIEQNYGSVSPVVVDINRDGLTDLVYGLKGAEDRTRMHVVYGSSKIPGGVKSIRNEAVAHKQEILLAPNPATEWISVSFETPPIGRQSGEILISNVAGVEISRSRIDVQSTASKSVFDVSSFAPGVYFVIIADAAGIYRSSFIKL